jgi:hypothetical protein
MDYFPFPNGQLSGCLDSMVLLAVAGAAWAAGAVMSAVPVTADAAAPNASTLRLEIAITARYVFGRGCSKHATSITPE